MEKLEKNFYITTSIPYANAAPHVGHILDPLIADVLARYNRVKGYHVRFLVGTDEHGAKIVRTAEAQGKTPRELVDENSQKVRDLHAMLNISSDDFIRTSDQKRHWPGAQKMWLALVASGDIYKKQYHGLYCVGHEAFVTQKDLVNGMCHDHQKAPEAIEEENWFFKLSKYAKEIELRIKKNELKIVPESRKNEILSLIENGLEDVSFSRPKKDLSWGVPVPDDSGQTMYVWCDALVNYISAIGYGHEDQESRALFKSWWPAEAQIIGKDNLRFHAAIWPGMLLSAGLDLPKTIFVHGFVNIEGAKISKTVGNVIFPEEIIGKYGVDPIRYYFLREFPSHEDGDFSYKKFEDRYNGDLANGIGNLVARAATLGEKVSSVSSVAPELIEKQMQEISQKYDTAFDEFHLHEALGAVWELISIADKYINEEKPWVIKDSEELKKVLAAPARIICEVSRLLEPFLPETSKKINEQFALHDSFIEIKKAGNLFPRI